MTPEREEQLRNFDIQREVQKCMEALSHRRRPSGRFYHREVGLLLLDNMHAVIQEIMDNSKQFVHVYEGDPNRVEKPNVYRPRNDPGQHPSIQAP